MLTKTDINFRYRETGVFIGHFWDFDLNRLRVFRNHTYLFGDMNYGERLLYIKEKPEFYFSWFDVDNYGEVISELEDFIKENKLDNDRTLLRLARIHDVRLSFNPLIHLRCGNAHEATVIRVKVLPIKEIWQSLSRQQRNLLK
jgi:hypothetical protein